ncbi:MAG: glycosyl transferase family 2 [Deltaproteobacteria bacterium CG_4_8_14_3_um_filter_51_11]|nr:glycosyltransferase [bacterium]OIP38452.1 MAG: glycosyl transferase family 2 [Desulfobacteraceae bacterium CG2_30_51_40]PIP46355.1 MAG: glycosyl transferase family 2 [Deltaproteobacteria bacterium CG23_combo_of_CG06-09_8_20_14_all_51_20]PIW01706.1 MAG: glycosyl transferase family 2 [Deltaproteobacteria bacterium CG17_big_fil_post_rev_8_21_14_2_50_51_6]PIX18264.1 MAG: glycosyl transferase family 2 [Deltaproteobacteria bacterium CG_4_8_14_3_um_filter_51_11]PIY22494.1 MAG: glycosyl transferase
MTHYNTALRSYTAKRVEEIESADIIVGIPCFNNEKTIEHVVQMVSHGLADHYKDKRSVIMIADGGSTDDTREVSKEFEIKPWQEKIISIYRGPGGKGTALRSVFEAAQRLKVKACAVVDSDLRSITPDWVKFLLSPVLEKGYQFVSPVYMRHKYDGTITNNIVYNLTRALYGKRVRQPIGGDFAFSRDVASYYADQDVWETDVARYGIDIWMTTSAITRNFKICQSNLGVKIHDAKDPGQHLGPMFRQVLWTIFSLMEKNEEYWKQIKASEPLEVFGYEGAVEPEPVRVNLDGMIEHFKTGFDQFSVLWKDIFSAECFAEIEKTFSMGSSNFHISTEAWIRIVYELAATFHAWKVNRNKLLDLMTPLYYARVASFVRQSWDMTSLEAEGLVEEQATKFEDDKEYLLKVWEDKYRKAALIR